MGHDSSYSIRRVRSCASQDACLRTDDLPLGSAKADFQKDAVTGILNHYLKEFATNEESSSHQQNITTLNKSGTADAEANALRALVDSMPPTSPVMATVRGVLASYDYEREVLAALNHQGFNPRFPQANTRLTLE